MAFPKLVFRRIQAFELTDLPWFPQTLRSAVTDAISFIARIFHAYTPAAPLLAHTLEAQGEHEVIDLCSGAGAPIDTIRRQLAPICGQSVRVTLTDKYPHTSAWARIVDTAGGRVSAEASSVDAANVPSRLRGFRTMFTAFHHFRPAVAEQILKDAANRRSGIAIFEYTNRNLLRWIFPTLMTPPTLLLITPFIRPFSLARLFWTYIIPIIPLAVTWDCFISGLRTYLPEELEAMARRADNTHTMWEVGITGKGVTYLIGRPRNERL